MLRGKQTGDQLVGLSTRTVSFVWVAGPCRRHSKLLSHIRAKQLKTIYSLIYSDKCYYCNLNRCRRETTHIQRIEMMRSRRKRRQTTTTNFLAKLTPTFLPLTLLFLSVLLTKGFPIVAQTKPGGGATSSGGQQSIPWKLSLKADNSNEGEPANKPSGSRKRRGRKVNGHDPHDHYSSGNSTATAPAEAVAESNKNKEMMEGLLKRVTQLEQMVARQSVEVRRLKEECKDLTEAAAAFARVVELLRDAGLQTGGSPKDLQQKEVDDKQAAMEANSEKRIIEYFDDSEILGKAPASVIEAADAAGSAILAMMLGGKQRMLVDVRDAELSRDPETLVQFIELAILPVAAGLEGLKSQRNRLKIVFPTVSQLLVYRKTMALAAPEVVALSTFGLEPVEKQDNLVVIVAPSPDDEEGLMAMNELLHPTDPNRISIKQPVVILNHHMVPISGPVADFEVAYHLRLLSVQYMSGNDGAAQEYFKQFEGSAPPLPVNTPRNETGEKDSAADANATTIADTDDFDRPGDALLEAAMEHAQQVGMSQGVTRAMVIRAYPKPWHVFVDTSPGTDADFVVAATYDNEPSPQEVNIAIVECLEGSEREDELVAQQMQEALESGQLDRVSKMLEMLDLEDGEEDEDDEGDSAWGLFGEDTV